MDRLVDWVGGEPVGEEPAPSSTGPASRLEEGATVVAAPEPDMDGTLVSGELAEVGCGVTIGTVGVGAGAVVDPEGMEGTKGSGSKPQKNGQVPSCA
jgi:hypothetical protein